MLNRRSLVLAFAGLALAGCATTGGGSPFSRGETVQLERDPYASERATMEELNTLLSNASADPVDVQGAFEKHAGNLLAHSKNSRDQQALQNALSGSELETAFLNAKRRDGIDEKEAIRIKRTLDNPRAKDQNAARRAMWSMASRTIELN